MTKYIFHLSGENIDLAKYELLSVTNRKKAVRDKDLSLVDLKSVKGLDKRLAFTHSIYRLLFTCNKRDLLKKVGVYNWDKVYKESFKVTIKGDLRFSEKDLGSSIWCSLKRPIVDVRNPKTHIVIFVRSKVYVCLLVADTDKSYLQRKPHMLPGLHPSGMNPKLAKSFVNFLQAKKGNLILDPFCGSSGLLLEAALLGYKVEGFDIDERMIAKARSNFKHFGIDNYVLKLKDARSLKRKVKYVITDLPYGRGTKDIDAKLLYLDFIKLLETMLQNRAVVAFPSSFNLRRMVDQSRLNVLKSFKVYIHRSLSKQILVLSK